MTELLTPRRVIAGVAAILLVSSGIAAVWAWAPNPADLNGLAPAAEKSPAQSEISEFVRAQCDECGVVESARTIERSDAAPGEQEGQAGMPRPPRISEVTVRMSNGASHLFTDSSRANWRPGERVIIIEGTTR